MEELQWLFYILLAVIVWVVRMWLKAFASPKANNNRPPNKQQAYPAPAPPGTSYQDILKEMQAAGNRAKKVEEPVYKEGSTSENISREPRSLEKISSPARSLEKLPPLSAQKRTTLSALEQTRQTPKRESTKVVPSVNYGKLLRNPQNVRTAFILSEILNRRDF